MTQPDRTPYCTKIRYGIAGAPTLTEDEMDGSHAPGIGLAPKLIELIYSVARDGKPASVSASVTGEWTRFGERADGQVTVHFTDGPDGWPAWLAEEARLHDPASSAGVAPAPDQTALRDRIAEALSDARRPGLGGMTEADAVVYMADAVLTVLPAELLRAQAEAHQYRTALQGVARRAAVLPASVDRADEEHRLALSMALGLGTGAPWDAIHDRVTELGLPPLAEDPVAQRLGLVPAPVDRATLVGILAVHAEQLAATLRSNASTGIPQLRAGVERSADLMDLHRRQLLAGQWTGDVRQMLTAMLEDITEATPADRAAVLREAAEALGRIDYDTDSNDYGYDTYRDAWNGGVMDAAAELRRVAAETPNTTVEIVHGCPPDGSGLTPCCGRTPFELPLGDRISSEAPITCPGPDAPPAGGARQPSEADNPPAAFQPRHTCHDQKTAPGHDWDCQWCSTLPDDIGIAAQQPKEA